MQNDAEKQFKKSSLSVNLLLILIVILLAVIPLFLAKDAEFGGADGEAEEVITEIKADYEPWFEPIFEPKSGEIESLLFALQAAIGAGVIGYGLGYLKERKRKEDEQGT
ncbi:MAG: energy-coupling factor ABC transporter substrate-binding protein [Firmicutes bacterium HGW-Firmicutes-13]|nr:MAG: energy-coupling factor ABC transporter substrate-binding protein [Firmicutes bacterium HGW-Firmicutes-13]